MLSVNKKGAELSKENNYDILPRRIESVKVVEIVELKVLQVDSELPKETRPEDSYIGIITEYWTKDGEFLTSFRSKPFLKNSEG